MAQQDRFLSKSFKKAIDAHRLHEKMLAQFTLMFDQSLVQKWKGMIFEWNLDKSKPDPYAEDETGKPFKNSYT